MAQYSIDNGTLYPIQVAAHNSTVQNYGLVSFQTPTLPSGPHHLYVQYGPSNDTTAPLVLDYLVIQNLTIPTFTPPPPSSTSSTSSTSPASAASAQAPTGTQTHSHARLSKGAVAGIVIGSLIAAIILFIFVIKYNKRKKASTQPQYPDGR
jgi:hypothetical protein